MSGKTVAVIIVNWNGREDTLECLESLRGVDYPWRRALLVDNGSSDGTVAEVRERFPEVEVIETGGNIGFAAGNNAGIQRALDTGADAVLLLNNDTTVDPSFLTILTEALYRSPDIGAVNPTIYYYDEPNMIWSAGGLIDERTGIACQRCCNEAASGHLGPELDVDYGVGAALLIRREAIEAAGLLDQRFFLYYEETDWCLRAGDAGFRVVYVPQAKVWHKVSRSTASAHETLIYYFCRNRLLLLKKRRAGALRLLGISLLDFGRMSLAMALRGRYRESRLVLRGVADFYLGRFGKAAL